MHNNEFFDEGTFLIKRIKRWRYERKYSMQLKEKEMEDMKKEERSARNRTLRDCIDKADQKRKDIIEVILFFSHVFDFKKRLTCLQ
jgi:hypothetical protein